MQTSSKMFQIEELMLTAAFEPTGGCLQVWICTTGTSENQWYSGSSQYSQDLPGTPITNQRCIRLQGEVGLYSAMDDFLWTSIRPSLRLDMTRLCQFSIFVLTTCSRPTWNPILQLVPESVPISFCCPIFPDSLSFLSSGYYYSRFKLDSDHVKPAPSTPVEDAFATVLILVQSYGMPERSSAFSWDGPAQLRRRRNMAPMWVAAWNMRVKRPDRYRYYSFL